MTTRKKVSLFALAAIAALLVGSLTAGTADAGCGGYGGFRSYSSFSGYGGFCSDRLLTSCYRPCRTVVHRPCLRPVYRHVTRLVCKPYTYPCLTYDCYGCPRVIWKTATRQVPVTQLVKSYVY